jgi:hypothetical protein
MTPVPPALAVQPRQPTRTNRLRLAAAAYVVAVIATVAVIAGLTAIAVRHQDRIADLQARDRAIIEVITALDAQLEVPGLDGAAAISLASTEPMGGSSEPTSNPVLTPTLQG